MRPRTINAPRADECGVLRSVRDDELQCAARQAHAAPGNRGNCAGLILPTTGAARVMPVADSAEQLPTGDADRDAFKAEKAVPSG